MCSKSSYDKHPWGSTLLLSTLPKMNLIDSFFIPCSISISLQFSIWPKGQKEEDGHNSLLVKNDADQLLKVSKTRRVSIFCVNIYQKTFHHRVQCGTQMILSDYP